MTEVNSFAFHRSYHDTLKSLPDDQRLALSDAIGAYAFEGQQPAFEDPMLEIVWGLMAPNIDASVRKSKSNSKRTSTRKPKPNPHGNSHENPSGEKDGKPSENPESIGTEWSGVDGNPSSNEEEGSPSTAPSGSGAAAAKAAPPLTKCPECGRRMFKNTQTGRLECDSCCKSFSRDETGVAL